jgi:hypothetical protein
MFYPETPGIFPAFFISADHAILSLVDSMRGVAG